MDINTQNLIKERMDSLPPEFKTALATIDWAKIVQEIGQKNNIHVDKIGDLQTETMLVLMGVTHPGDFQTEIERALQLPEDSGAGILNDINEKILLPLRKKVMEATGEKEEVAKPADAESFGVAKPASAQGSGEAQTEEDKSTVDALRRLDRMPDEINKLIGDPTLPTKISSVGKSANMSETELSDLEDIISMVFLGYIHPDRLGVEIKSKFNYPDAKVTLVADGVNKEIFAPIRGALIKNYDDSLEKAVSSGEVLKMAGVEVLGETQEVGPSADAKALADKLKPGPEVGPLTPVNIAAQKLSATFRMPKQETDLSLVKTIESPKKIDQAPLATPAKTIDPYKEKI